MTDPFFTVTFVEWNLREIVIEADSEDEALEKAEALVCEEGSDVGRLRCTGAEAFQVRLD